MSAADEFLKRFRLDTLIAELRAREDRAKKRPGQRVPLPELKRFRSRELIEYIRQRQRAIYGTDGREEVFAIAGQKEISRSADSVVTVCRSEDITDNGDGTSTLKTEALGTRYTELCRKERFIDQPVGGQATGFLVADDVIATAGHVVDDTTVGGTRFVFGFRMIDATNARTTVPNGEVYSGMSIIDRMCSTSGADWALVRLDRKATGHYVARLRKSGTIADKQGVYVIGHPLDLPLKYAGSANVRDNTPSTHFVANLDTYGGNSGSPVFNADTHEVEGILVRGEADFVYDDDAPCQVSLVCPDTGCRGQDCTRVSFFAHLI